MKSRHAGILLPITALPSPYGVGSLGREAREFIDFLVRSGQKIWQVLPLVPTGYGDSPYSSSCATAGSPYLIDIDALIDQGLITSEEAEEYSCEDKTGDASDSRVNYEALFYRRIPLLKIALSRFDRSTPEFIAFINKGEFNDFALFMAIKESHSWQALRLWDEKYRKRDAQAISEFASENEDLVLFWQFTQYMFFKQWGALKNYANSRGIQIMGDMPLYVSEDSAEVFAHPELFLLDEHGFPSEVAGVPPDYFSEDGQLWGNPLYNWEGMRKDGYAWWTARLKSALSMYDIVRIDHFRGFDRFYAIPAGSLNARVGKWYDGPKESLFEDKLDWKIVAEDLGILDEGVYRLMRNTGYPGMKVLEFAFDGDPEQAFKPSNYEENCVCYTGTHDNDTFIGFISGMNDDEKRAFYTDLRAECKKFHIDFRWNPNRLCSIKTMQRARVAVITAAYLSRANWVILPLQDILGTGGDTRMNLPGTLGTQNWSWRYKEGALTDELAGALKDLVILSKR